MGKKPRKPRRRKEEHPTLFVYNNSIRYYEEGSMLELHTQVNKEEWSEIVEQTIAYKIFIDCLKESAYPKLEEKWTVNDDWYRVQLDVAVSRIRNIDPLLVARYNQGDIKSSYLKQIELGTKEVNKLIEEFKSASSSNRVRVTDL
jgi:hypothetical protein